MLFLRYIHCTVCYYTNAMPEERKNLWRFDGSAVWPCKPYNSCNLPFRPRSSGNLIFALNCDVPVATMLVLVRVTSDFVLISVISQVSWRRMRLSEQCWFLDRKKKEKKKKEKYRSDRVTPVKDVPLETLQIFISICKYWCNLIVNIIRWGRKQSDSSNDAVS